MKPSNFTRLSVGLCNPKMASTNIDELLNEQWLIGYKSRGHGHGDYSIITLNEEEIIIDLIHYDLAEHIVELHNEKLKTEGYRKIN